MIGDLISRSALLEEMRKFSGNQRYLISEEVWRMVRNAPISCDMDKVVERLGILSDSANDKIMEQEGSEQYWDGFGDGIDKAIKIVKGGGLNG